ncbi:hypothetical protein [Candidatus Methylospira mobilis]|uniref:hypothetical protein n=1 Tax=Candidatus Methylospira mobilis TaxID=1808979 RepID=UPI001D177A84|nr:hypothetical protein [Candidatus Methylospira mobilis]
MLAALGVYGFSILAGRLSALSPYVLPLIPILVGTALTAHGLGPGVRAGPVVCGSRHLPGNDREVDRPG